MWWTALAALVVGYVPGALIFRAPVASRERRAALSSEERTFWAVVISVTWSLVVVLSLAGLGAFTFSRLIATNLALSAVLLACWRGRLGYGSAAPRPSWSTLIPIGLVALGSFLYFPTAEYVIGGKDPGTYVSEGVQIAQHRGLVIADPVVSSVPPASRDLFFPWHKTPYYFSLRFMGFFVQDPAAGEVIGQFPHLFPASIAIGYGLNGLTGARDAVGAWALLGLVAVYLCGARLFGRTAAAAATVLLAINVVEIWFARYPNSEMPMQALVFAAILAFSRAAEGSRLFFGAIAGALLGLMLFLRYDVVLAMAAFVAAATVLPVAGQRIGISFAIVLALTAAVGLWYLAGLMMAYSAYPLGFTRDQGGWWIVGAAGIAMLAFRWLVRRERAAALVRRALPIGLAVAVVALAVHAYFLRDMSGERIAVHDAMAFRSFAWYVTPWLLAVSVAGLGVLVSMRFWRDPAFFLTLVTFSVFFFYKTRIAPEHFWASRRFLAVILPGALLVAAGFAALAAERIAFWIERWRHRVHGGDRQHVPRALARLASSLFVACALAPAGVVFWQMSEPVREHHEYAGLIAELERLAAAIGPEDLLLVESRDAGSDLHVLALPLAYIYAKSVLVVDSAAPAKRQLENFVAWAETRYEDVLFLGGGGTDLLTRRLLAEPLTSSRFRVAEYETRTNAYPQGVLRKDFEYGLFRLALGDRRPAGPIDFEIGLQDDLNVVRFHARERHSDGTMFRWSGPQSFVLLLGIASDARKVTVWMGNGGRPAAAPPATVDVALDETPLGTATVGSAVQPYDFDLPAALAATAAAGDDPVRLRLRVPPWTPAATVGGADTRALGVIVRRVQVR
jgi:hypothetical protein